MCATYRQRSRSLRLPPKRGSPTPISHQQGSGQRGACARLVVAGVIAASPPGRALADRFLNDSAFGRVSRARSRSHADCATSERCRAPERSTGEAPQSMSMEVEGMMSRTVQAGTARFQSRTAQGGARGPAPRRYARETVGIVDFAARRAIVRELLIPTGFGAGCSGGCERSPRPRGRSFTTVRGPQSVPGHGTVGGASRIHGGRPLFPERLSNWRSLICGCRKRSSPDVCSVAR